MPSKYYFAYFDTEDNRVPNAAIESILDDGDWARLRGGAVYLVYSDKEVKQLRDELHKLIGPNDHILIGEFNKENRSGWLSKTTIQWMNEKRD